MATSTLDYSSVFPVIDTPWHYADYFHSLNYSLQLEIERKIKEIKGQDYNYDVNIRFDRECNVLRPHFFYVIQVRKEEKEKYSNVGNTLGTFVFTLKSKVSHDHDCDLQELLQEFHDLLDGFVEKLLLAEELFDRYNIHINEDMEGIDIEVRKVDGKTEYRLTKTSDYQLIADSTKEWAGYNHVAACNQKDGIVSLIVDNWMTLDEIITTINLVNE